MQYDFDGRQLPSLVYCDGETILILDNDGPLTGVGYRALVLAKATLEIGMQRVERALADKQAAENDPMVRRMR